MNHSTLTSHIPCVTNQSASAATPSSAGVPIYAFLKARRERRGDVEEPVESTTTAFGAPTTVLHGATSVTSHPLSGVGPDSYKV
jgi:hypothetical protein